MAEPARHLPEPDESSEDLPPLDSRAVERAYRRERAKRRAVATRRHAARSSNARFWVVLAVLTFLTVFVGLTAWQQIQSLFGI